VSYNGSGTFVVNSSGQPVVTGTVISSTAFNALTADLATGLSTAITKDGQTTTTARILFAQGVSSTLVTDATSATTGSIITAGGISMQKALWVGTTATIAGATTMAGITATSLALGGATLGTNALAVTGTTQLNSALNYGGVTLSNSVTGTGSMVLSASAALTGSPTVTNNQAALSEFSISNNNGGSNGGAAFKATNGTYNGYAIMWGSTGGGGGINAANTFSLQTGSTGGLVLGTTVSAPVICYINSVEKMRLDTSGNLGIGMTPSNILDITKTQNSFTGAQITNSSAGASAYTGYQLNNGTITGGVYLGGTGNADPNLITLAANSGGSVRIQPTGGSGITQFYTNGSESARINSSGSLCVGTTSSVGTGCVSASGTVTTSNGGVVTATQGASGNYCFSASAANNGGSYFFMVMQGGTGGSILNNGTITSYNATSDERLKNWDGIVQSDKRQMIDDLWLGDFDIYDDFTKTSAPHRGFGVRSQQAYSVLGEQFGLAPPAKETDRWQAPSEPMAYLSLWGVKDLYKIIDELTTRLAALENK